MVGIDEKAILLHATLFYKYNPARTQRPIITAKRTPSVRVPRENCAVPCRTAGQQLKTDGRLEYHHVAAIL